MPPILYSTVCKICRWRRGGINFDLAVRVISRHLTSQHGVSGSIGGKDPLALVKELRKVIPHLPSNEDGTVTIVVEDATIIYDRVTRSWTVVTPLFEIGAGLKIKEEERIEAKRIAEEIKEKRKTLVECEQKRIKYKKRYSRYTQKYYGDYLKDSSLHTIQNLTSERSEHAEFMHLWTEYISLKTTKEDTPEFSEARKSLKKHRLYTQPVSGKDLNALRINFSRLCSKCPLKILCKLSFSSRFFGSEEELVRAGCIKLQERWIERKKFEAKIAQMLASSP